MPFGLLVLLFYWFSIYFFSFPFFFVLSGGGGGGWIEVINSNYTILEGSQKIYLFWYGDFNACFLALLLNCASFLIISNQSTLCTGLVFCGDILFNTFTDHNCH